MYLYTAKKVRDPHIIGFAVRDYEEYNGNLRARLSKEKNADSIIFTCSSCPYRSQLALWRSFLFF